MWTLCRQTKGLFEPNLYLESIILARVTRPFFCGGGGLWAHLAVLPRVEEMGWENCTPEEMA